jgi:hypothetical protein
VGGARIEVEDRLITADSSTVVCWGVGHPSRKHTSRVWRRFSCIAPTFRGAVAGPDALFVLVPLDSKRFVIRQARFSRY